MKNNSIINNLMLPAVATLVALFLVFILVFKFSQVQYLEQHSSNKLEVYKTEFEATFELEAESLISLLDLITNQVGARDALKKQDQQELYDLFFNTYEKLRKAQGITHFYFHSTTLKNVIRLHDPDRFGDKISRQTSLRAASTLKPSYGFELGVLGTFTLRAVAPVWQNNTIIGYVELGKEVEDIASSISNTFDLGWTVIIDKSYLVEKDWRDGMKILGRKSNWHQFKSVVLSSNSTSTPTPELDTLVIEEILLGHTLLSLSEAHKIGVINLIDMENQQVGWLLVYLDESALLDAKSTRNRLIYLFLSLLLIAMIFFVRKLLIKTDNSISEQQEKLHFHAHHDALTGLPNRKLFYERLNLAIALSERKKHQLAVVFIDLDNFKDINDSLGHQVGDSVLRGIAKKLSPLIRKEDTFARISGDEFVILMEEFKELDDCSKTAERIIDIFKTPFSIGLQSISITASIGIAVYPNDALTSEELLASADRAMYHAKSQEKGTYYFYNKKLSEANQRRITLETKLRSAIEKDELFLVYQPQLDLKSNEISGIETLVRWKNSELGLIPPLDFIPVAENAGLINHIGHWVLFEAIRTAAIWIKKDLNFGRVAVNISAKQLLEPDFTHQVLQCLEKNHLPASKLELEVTESVFMSNLEISVPHLESLKQLGVSISIDDFGTGYSSLSQIKHLPISTLKIDKSFIDGLPKDQGDAAITRTIIAMSKSLQLFTIAEGVETQEQLSFLKDHSCDCIQGYLFSKPVSTEELENLLVKQKMAS